ncbi:MAG: hypothetical protein IPG94_21145 [Kineosporiaceae bacterium]|nr:hypothetical protein [Kineosporiaceae bacterium]
MDLATAGQTFRYLKVQLAGAGYLTVSDVQATVPPTSTMTALVDSGSVGSRFPSVRRARCDSAR